LIPYTTNNFIFDDAMAFSTFFRTAKHLQIRAIRTISLQIKSTTSIYKFSSCGSTRPHIGFWNVVLRPKLIRQFTGLENLYINFYAKFWSPSSLQEVDEMGPLAAGCAVLFRELPLKKVKTIATCPQLVVYDVESGEPEEVSYANKDLGWPLKARQDFAKVVSDVVLNKAGFSAPRYEYFQAQHAGVDEDDFWDHFCFDRVVNVYMK